MDTITHLAEDSGMTQEQRDILRETAEARVRHVAVLVARLEMAATGLRRLGLATFARHVEAAMAEIEQLIGLKQ